MSVLKIRKLSVSIGGHTVVDSVDLDVGRGERVGLLGESGSGKSLTCMATLGLLPATARATGSVRLVGEEILGSNDRRMRALRGAELGCVFQEPQSALDPLARIGDQLTSTLRARARLSRHRRHELAVALAARVGLPDPERIVRRFPHELSGGQRQRVVVAMATAAAPALVLADEPTTALDVTVQAHILELLGGRVAETGAALLLVTHDIAVAATTCDRLVVMRGGRVVEQGSTHDLLRRPAHPYTRALIDAAYATTYTRPIVLAATA
ncbi:ABC transporter ATP-binding protein [Cryobacterium sp. Y50]|uniref:ABC transporter ATP-binding protein n=1 Tax=Cryobacterium sp. Y50 TaxID=2048286 RepID=UPI000CE44550|nr:ABC transporter ATP-binding protein [Cryobacterium sp. Y50]